MLLRLKLLNVTALMNLFELLLDLRSLLIWIRCGQQANKQTNKILVNLDFSGCSDWSVSKYLPNICLFV